MGCSEMFVHWNVPEQDTKLVRERGQELIQEHKYKYGHGGYTGSFDECAGCEVTNRRFSNAQDAIEWLSDNAEKWGPMLAVRVDVKHENGDFFWIFGGLCSS